MKVGRGSDVEYWKGRSQKRRRANYARQRRDMKTTNNGGKEGRGVADGESKNKALLAGKKPSLLKTPETLTFPCQKSWGENSQVPENGARLEKSVLGVQTLRGLHPCVRDQGRTGGVILEKKDRGCPKGRFLLEEHPLGPYDQNETGSIPGRITNRLRTGRSNRGRFRRQKDRISYRPITGPRGSEMVPCPRCRPSEKNVWTMDGPCFDQGSVLKPIEIGKDQRGKNDLDRGS